MEQLQLHRKEKIHQDRSIPTFLKKEAKHQEKYKFIMLTSQTICIRHRYRNLWLELIHRLKWIQIAFNRQTAAINRPLVSIKSWKSINTALMHKSRSINWKWPETSRKPINRMTKKIKIKWRNFQYKLQIIKNEGLSFPVKIVTNLESYLTSYIILLRVFYILIYQFM